MRQPQATGHQKRNHAQGYKSAARGRRIVGIQIMV
jgi:hypothetical protein